MLRPTLLACGFVLLVGCTRPASEPLPEPLAAPAAAPSSSPASTPPPMTPTPTPTPAPPPATTQLATFAAGCFWCSEAVLLRVDGVLAVVSGYIGGALEHPTYEQVCSGITGHAEAVQVTFDPARVSFAKLCELFFALHDPTTLNRQGNDVGTQYRSAIFYHDEAQQTAAAAAIAAAQPHFAEPIVTEVAPAGRFWPAEPYHQNYFGKNPDNRYCRIMIPPKLKKLGLDAR
jgi:peptide-methionine (S)-S-oxide reductase